jgi:hypothetical protein
MPRSEEVIVNDFKSIINDMREKISNNDMDMSCTNKKLEQLILETNNSRIVQAKIQRLTSELYQRLHKSIAAKNDDVMRKLETLAFIDKLTSV